MNNVEKCIKMVLIKFVEHTNNCRSFVEAHQIFFEKFERVGLFSHQMSSRFCVLEVKRPTNVLFDHSRKKDTKDTTKKTIPRTRKPQTTRHQDNHKIRQDKARPPFSLLPRPSFLTLILILTLKSQTTLTQS